MRTNNRRIGSNNVLLIVGVITALAYFSIGVWFAFSQTPLFNIAMNTQRILGVICILYSLFRGYTLYSRFFRKPKSGLDDVE
jgi:hypothetical protein